MNYICFINVLCLTLSCLVVDHATHPTNIYIYIYIYVDYDCKICEYSLSSLLYKSVNKPLCVPFYLSIYTNIFYVYIYSVLFFLHNCPLLIPLHNTAILFKICRFWINVVKFMQTLTKLDLPTLRKGSTEEWTQRNK